MAILRRPAQANFSFSEWQKSRPNTPPPGDALDGAFTELRDALISTQEALAELRRDDGNLRNATVGREQLQPALVESLTARVEDQTQTAMRQLQQAISGTKFNAQEMSLIARDAEAAAVSAAQFLSAISAIDQRVRERSERVERISGVAEYESTEAENWAKYSQAQAENAIEARDDALAWAEYLAGPVVSGPEAPDFIAQSAWPHGLFYQPVDGAGGTGGLWSAKWWAVYCQQLVGNLSFYYLGGWDHPPAPGEVNPDTGQQVPSPLAPGSIYYDSTEGALKVWNGEYWISPFSLTGGVTSRFSYIATSGQTVFSGSDMFTHVPAFDASVQHDVHLNGVKLVRDDGTGKGDYTVNDTTDALTLLTAASAGSVVQWDLLVAPEKLQPGAATIYKVATLTPDGATTDFAMSYSPPGGGSAPVNVIKPAELLVVQDGIPQEAGVDYTAAGANLHMNVAPPLTAKLWALWFKSGGP